MVVMYLTPQSASARGTVTELEEPKEAVLLLPSLKLNLTPVASATFVTVAEEAART